ncbi:hypothetical protein [Streptococcus suis]|uniref:hypothetical protein n=1 Tax=Streptococcus suis TaxID=1307 RepID=UPI001F05954A|nr:hypothetical protein [Streptococcus suis]MCH1645068.1 hypothetical protein [Streptococcus suis]
MERLDKMFNGIYGWTVKADEIIAPTHDLPDAVKERVAYFREMAEDGMTFLGVMECIFANEKPDSYDFGATKDWLPMSQEFKDWVGYANSMAQMEIAVYMIYGVRKEATDDK